MADLQVDLEGLAALAARLDGARDGLSGALGAMADVGAAPLGTDELDRACGEFQQSWSYGLGKLGECVEAVRGGVDASSATYTQAEQCIADTFTGTQRSPEPQP